MCHSGRAQHSLPIAADTRHVAVGEEGVHPSSAEVACHEKASVRQEQKVSYEHKLYIVHRSKPNGDFWAWHFSHFFFIF